MRSSTAEPRAIYRPAGGFTPLLYVAREGCIECAKSLAEGGADLNLADPEGVSPLLLSILNQHFDLASYLIQKGANPNRWDWYGRTPLYAAVQLRNGVRLNRIVTRQPAEMGRTMLARVPPGERLYVYKRGGEPCLRCDTTIGSVELGGRSSWFCERCQS